MKPKAMKLKAITIKYTCVSPPENNIFFVCLFDSVFKFENTFNDIPAILQ
jgi:hypothetical protein